MRRQIAKTCRLHGCYLLFSVLCGVSACANARPGEAADLRLEADAAAPGWPVRRGAVGVAVVSLCRMARGDVGDEGQLQLHARKSTRFDMHYSAFSGVPRARIAASVERAIDGRESDNKSERRVGSLRLFGLAESQRNRGFVCFGSRAERTLHVHVHVHCNQLTVNKDSSDQVLFSPSPAVLKVHR